MSTAPEAPVASAPDLAGTAEARRPPTIPSRGPHLAWRVTPVQQFVLVALRFAVGWHLCYQGWGKLQAVEWTSGPYLRASTGPFAAWFQALAESPGLWLADHVVMWSLVALGALLMIGLLTRTASALAILLLLSFYLASPPWPVHGFLSQGPTGPELYVNAVLIEMLALGVCAVFDTGRMAGLDILIRGRRRRIGADRVT